MPEELYPFDCSVSSSKNRLLQTTVLLRMFSFDFHLLTSIAGQLQKTDHLQ